MIYNMLHSILILKDSIAMFDKYCIAGLKANRKKIEEYVESSLMLITALSPVIGYDKCAKIAKLAHEKNMNLRDACVKLGYISGAEFDRIVVPEEMTRG
jgi:fumarate hydratase class II